MAIESSLTQEVGGKKTLQLDYPSPDSWLTQVSSFNSVSTFWFCILNHLKLLNSFCYAPFCLITKNLIVFLNLEVDVSIELESNLSILTCSIKEFVILEEMLARNWSQNCACWLVPLSTIFILEEMLALNWSQTYSCWLVWSCFYIGVDLFVE